jgi:WD40 repeat protein
LAASSHRKIMIYDSESLELKNTLEGHKDSVVDISFSSCSKYLVSASNDKNVILWDPERKKPEEKKNNQIIKTEDV